MKLFTFISLMLLGFAQLSIAQDLVETPKLNPMSNVFGITTEAGATLGFTDYSTQKISYTGKLSMEYYLPATGQGNIGFRGFGQFGFIAGEVPPAGSGNPTNEYTTKMVLYGGGVFYTLSIGDAVYPWLGLGVSHIYFYPEDANGNKLPNFEQGNYKRNMLAYNGDAGVRIMVSKNLSFNINAGVIVGSKDYLDDIQSGPSNDIFYTATAGLTYYFGRDRDSDGDGIPNSIDACPDTPIGVKVDEFGCSLDTDRDAVPDYLDKCSNTPAGVKVDADGCPLDFDRDGVPDYLDKCSNTPAGVTVDQNGCPLDSDNDGVRDDLDKCPNTPKGVQVDSDGCAIKKEKETVIIIQPGEIKTLVLSGDTNFEFNKSKLLPNAYAALKDIVITMNEHTEYKWEVGGHTDGIGSVNYNTKLSEQRAQSVVDYLVSQGVKRNNLNIVGYGKSNPIATNDTNEGRSMNRRVEIKLLSK
ncbi:MAG: OmpA family protein [Bacteroidetes bacterium]|nr:OmpA family protein [Bacteroidota bacterium]